MSKPYEAKTLSGAQKKIQGLLKERDELFNLLNRCSVERKALAKLAAEGPAFFNPLEAFAAQEIRDRILAENGMNPDGSFK